MNYTEFIKKADQAAGSMAQERLAAFLHDYARSVPEHKREEFLERLFSFAGKKADADETGIQDALGKEQLKGAIERNMQQLAVINDGELVLEEVYEEKSVVAFEDCALDIDSTALCSQLDRCGVLHKPVPA